MADEMRIDEYNQALDYAGPEGGDADAPEEPEDVGGEAVRTADALGVTEAPTARTHILLDHHPEIRPDFEETVNERILMRDAYPPTADPKHTTYPFLTQYERAAVISLRATQLANGASPFIDVPEYLTDTYEIARTELEAKRLPYILKRPLPDGTFEYWRLADLILLG